MSVQEAERLQRELAPKEDLTPYIGQWVALRDGYVVAAELDPVSLREHPDVQPGDALIRVAASQGYFL